MAGMMAVWGGGCIDRRIMVTSEPPGALVWLNDVEVGRTPVTTRFLWYGDYEVRVRMDGYETVTARRTAEMPVYEHPPIDLVASALPIRIRRHWHFDLVPLKPSTPEEDAALVERARAMRAGALEQK